MSSQPGPEPYVSLGALQAAHRELHRRYYRQQGAGASVPDDLAREIASFLARGQASGAHLGDESERWTAQSLLDYWATTLYRSRQESVSATLEPFAGGAVNAQVERAEALFARLTADEAELARRLLLKVVRLNPFLEPVSRPSLQSRVLAREPPLAHAVLERLRAAGVVRLSSDLGTDEQLVALGDDTLLQAWPRLAAWLSDERTRARLTLAAAAEQWVATGRDPAALWWGGLLDNALGYEDLDEREREFVEASRRRRETRNRRQITLLSVGLALLVVLAALALLGWYSTDRQRQFVEAQSAIVAAFLDKRLDEALLLAVATYGDAPEPAARRGLLSALRYTQQAYAPFFPVRYLHGHHADVARLAFSADGSRVAATATTFAAELNRTVWELETGEVRPAGAFLPAPPGVVLECPGAAACTEADKVFRLTRVRPRWRALDGREASFFARNNGSHQALGAALSPDGRTLALGYRDGVVLWRLPDTRQPVLGRTLANFAAGGETQRADFDQAARTLALASQGGAVSLWTLGEAGAQHLRQVPAEAAPPLLALMKPLALSPDARQLAWLSSPNRLLVWDAATGLADAQPFPGQDAASGEMLSVAFSAEGDLLLGRRENAVSVWNARTRRGDTKTLEGLAGSVRNLALAGRTLAVTGQDNRVSLWRFERRRQTLKPIANPPVAELPVTALALSPEGRNLALGTSSGTILLWRARNAETPWTRERWEALGELATGGRSAVVGLSFSAGGDQLVSSSSDGSVVRWEVGTASLIGWACYLANPAFQERCP